MAPLNTVICLILFLTLIAFAPTGWAATSSGDACPLLNGKNAITRTESEIKVDLTGLQNPVGSLPSVQLFTSQNEIISCHTTNSSSSCTIPPANSNERSFKVQINCSNGQTNYYVTLQPKPVSQQSSSVPDLPFVFVFLIMIMVSIVLARFRK